MTGSQTLVQIVDSGLAEAVRKAGPWLACRPGCFACCLGPFTISPDDAERLREGMAAIEPDRAARIQQRARSMSDEQGDDDPCPALDPESGTCDVYEWRPIICRTFGPPLHFANEAIAICELCFVGATTEEVAACDVELPLELAEDDTETLTVASFIRGHTGH
jgi:Fe-S-cluster containining protein